MDAAYNIETKSQEFEAAREQFEGIVNWLDSQEAAKMTHYKLEEQLTQAGRELMRNLLQGHLDLRGLRETRLEDVTGSDGERHTQVRDSERGLMTVFGPVRVPRLQYVKPGQQSLFPEDGALNLPREVHSHGLRRLVAEEAAKGSFEEVVKTTERYTGAKVAKRQVEALAQRAAIDFDEFYRQRAVNGEEQTKELLILSFDGKGIVMLERDLRELTRKAAEKAEKKLSKRLSRGEKRNRKRMSTVAAVYTVDRHERTAEDVMKELGPVREVPKKRPKIRNKRVWASVKKEAEEVIEEAFQEALRRDPEHRRQWVVLVDGDPYQEQRIRRCAAHHGVKVSLVLDFIHVLEYLWKAAWSFFKEGDRKAERWVLERARGILAGRSSAVAGGIRRSATKRSLTKKKREAVDGAAKYLRNHRKMLYYDTALREGWPIATGVIEGACRHLVKDRMEITGARWSLQGAESVLDLRALRTSGDFDAYWEYHLSREQERNHLTRYAGHELPQGSLRLV